MRRKRLDFLTGSISEALAIQTGINPDRDKIDTLFRLICWIGNRSAIVFCNHRESVDRTSELLKEKGIVNVYYHGALEQPERDSALNKFRNGTSNVFGYHRPGQQGPGYPQYPLYHPFSPASTEEVFTHLTDVRPGWMPAVPSSSS